MAARPCPDPTVGFHSVRHLTPHFPHSPPGDHDHELALRADGEWRVIEVGDGQVSGLPAGAGAGKLFGVLSGVAAVPVPPG